MLNPLHWLARRRAAPRRAAATPPGEAERLLRRLDFTVVRRLDGMRQGDHRNLAFGAGLDLAELREYVPGDDVRALDWNVSARMGQPYVRTFHEDRDVTAWIILDLSESASFGSTQQSKQELLLDVAGTLARLLTSRGDRVGALLYAGSPVLSTRLREDYWLSRALRRQSGRRPAVMVNAGGGRQHVLQLLQRAMDVAGRARGRRTQMPDGQVPGSDLQLLLRQAFGVTGQRTLMFVVSDFLDTYDPALTKEPRQNQAPTERFSGAAVAPVDSQKAVHWVRALATLTRRHEVIGVWVRDPREEALPDVGVVMMEDAETGEQMAVDTSQPALREAYARQAVQRAQRMERAFARHGAALWAITTDEPLVTALVRFLEQRRRTLIGTQRLQLHSA